MSRPDLMKPIEPTDNTKGRELLNREIMPEYASYFKTGDKVYFIGKHRMWDYSAYFNNPALQCEFYTVDKVAAEKPDIVDDITQSRLESNSAEGVVFIGMDWDIPDPKQAFAEIRRILKPGGRIVSAFAGKGDTRGGTIYTLEQVMEYHKDYLVDEISFLYGSEAFFTKRYEQGDIFVMCVIARKPE